MERSRQKERWILYTLTVLLCMVLASFWLMCNIYARYSAEATGSDGARVAKFDVTDTGTATQQIETAVYPGSKEIYQVNVTNNSEVAIEYEMNVKNQYNNLPLQFRMLDSTGEEITSESSDASTKTYDLSKSVEISAQDKDTHTYQLEISWPTAGSDSDTDYQSPDYAGKVDVIEITLKAIQKD